MVGRLLFLDLDGVLNSGVYLCGNAQAAAKHRRRELVLDPSPMSRLNMLLDRHDDTGVVISSGWRKRYDYDILAIILHKNGFEHGHRVVGQTPNFGDCPRGFEILAWLKARGLACPYAILDDRGDMAGASRHLVRTDPICGLTSADVRKASAILSAGR